MLAPIWGRSVQLIALPVRPADDAAEGGRYPRADSLRTGGPCSLWRTFAVGNTYAQLVAGFGVGIATLHRYRAEAAEVLAAWRPNLATAGRAAALKAFVIRDGTPLPIDRIARSLPIRWVGCCGPHPNFLER